MMIYGKKTICAAVVLTVAFCADLSTGNTASWQLEPVDTESSTGWRMAIALDRNGQPGLCYAYAVDDYTRRGQKLALRSGNGWDIQTVPTTSGWYNDIAFDPVTNDAVVVYNTDDKELRWSQWNGSEWRTEVVYTDPLSVGWPKIQFDSTGNPGIAFTVGETSQHAGSVKYAYRNATGWTVSSVENIGIGFSRAVDMDMDGDGRVHIAYWTPSGELHYAGGSGQDWSVETVSQVPDPYRYQLSIAVDSANRPHISFEDDRAGLKYAVRNDGGWDIEQLGSYRDGRANCIAVGPDDQPRIVYIGSSTDAMHWAELRGTQWHLEVVEDSYASIPMDVVMDDDGGIHVGIYRSGNQFPQDVWYAYRAPEPATLSLLTLGGLAVLRRRRRKLETTACHDDLSGRSR